MKLQIYNTRTRTKEKFIPRHKGKVSIYACGPTVYDAIHIGNARPFVLFDTLVRLLKRTCDVTYVRNITDVDDKIMRAAHQQGISISELTQKTIKAFHSDMLALNALPPDIEPRATDHIAEMIEMISLLIEKKHAYVAQGHVLFDTRSDSSYGQLSRRKLDEMIAGARVEVAPYKKNAMDFVLWKPSDSEQPGWDSPWGRGRPGWHIECSAMSHKHLGHTFDIHCGGLDLIFPHHENEIAQSTCAHGAETFAQYWMHNGMLVVDGKKMSKSLGNFYTVQDLLQKVPGEVIRFTLLATHYRQPLDWTEKTLEQSIVILNRFYTSIKNIDISTVEVDEEILAALNDDLNTPKAIARLHTLVAQLNKEKSSESREKLASLIVSSARLMGFLYQKTEDWFMNTCVKGEGAEAEKIERLIAERIQARKAKNFTEADRIRQDLLAQGIVLEDTPDGTTWRRGTL